MALSAGDIVRTSCNFLLPSGDQYQNVFHHIFDGIGGVSDAAVVDDIQTWAQYMYGEIADFVVTGTVEQLSFVDQVEWVTDKWEVVASIGTFTPTFTPLSILRSLPNQSSPFVVFKTDRPKSVGRKFLFPVETPAQDGGILESDLVDALVQWADDAVNDITIDVANVLHPGIVRTAVNQFLAFQVAVVTDLIGSQRRRRQGDGA